MRLVQIAGDSRVHQFFERGDIEHEQCNGFGVIDRGAGIGANMTKADDPVAVWQLGRLGAKALVGLDQRETLGGNGVRHGVCLR